MPHLAYTTTQAALVVGRSHTRVKLAIRRGELTARKDGRATLIEHTELMRWLAALPTIGRKPEPVTAGPITPTFREDEARKKAPVAPGPTRGRPRKIARETHPQ